MELTQQALIHNRWIAEQVHYQTDHHVECVQIRNKFSSFEIPLKYKLTVSFKICSKFPLRQRCTDPRKKAQGMLQRHVIRKR